MWKVHIHDNDDIYKKYNKMCLLFSDYKGKDNLYDKVD